MGIVVNDKEKRKHDFRMYVYRSWIEWTSDRCLDSGLEDVESKE